MDKTTEINKIPPTIPNEIGEGMCTQGEINIFTPINDKITAKPYGNLSNMCMKFANKK